MWTGTVEEVDEEEDVSYQEEEEDMNIVFKSHSFDNKTSTTSMNHKLQPPPSHFRSIEAYRAYDESSDIYQEMKEKINSASSSATAETTSQKTSGSMSRRQKKNARKKSDPTTKSPQHSTPHESSVPLEEKKNDNLLLPTSSPNTTTTSCPLPVRQRLPRASQRRTNTSNVNTSTSTSTVSKSFLEHEMFRDPRTDKEKRKALLKEAKRNKQMQTMAAMRAGGMRNLLGNQFGKVMNDIVKEQSPDAAMSKTKDLLNVGSMSKTHRKNAREGFDQFAPVAMEMARDVFMGDKKEKDGKTQNEKKPNFVRQLLSSRPSNNRTPSAVENPTSGSTTSTQISFDVEEVDE